MNQLVGAREAAPDTWFMARMMGLCSLHHHLAFRVLVEAAHPGLANSANAHPICQEESYNPGRDVSINPNENSILTPWRPVPDVRLGYASTGHLPKVRDLFIENLLFHRARKRYFWMVHLTGKPTI